MTPQSPAPVAGRPLTAEDCKLLQHGDVLRWHDEVVTVFRVIGTVDIERPNGDICARIEPTNLTFIGRPDSDGWMPWSGGENPVPGQMVDWKARNGVSESCSSDELHGWNHPHESGSRYDIVAFRLSRPASEQPVEAIGAGRRELLERLEAEVSDETMRALLSCKDVGSGRAHFARILAALPPASPARTPMGERGDLREALECVEDYDHTGRLAGVLRQAIDGAVRIDHLTPDQQSDIRAHVTGLSDPEEETYEAPEHGWTCFHCGATFKTTRGARMHFGHNVTGRPKCHDPERLVEIYDGAQAAVAAASPAWVDFEVRVARRDEARNAIIAALAAPTPMGGDREHSSRCWGRTSFSDEVLHCYCQTAPTPKGGEVEALREAAKREEVARIVELAIVRHGVEETALEGTLRDADAILKALAASSPSPAQGGEQIARKAELYDHMREVAAANGFDSLTQAIAEAYAARQALSASPQPEAGEAVYRALEGGEVIQRGDQMLCDDCETWEDVAGWPIGATYRSAVFVPIRRPVAAPPSVQPVEGK